MNAKISIHHRQLPVSLWITGAVSFFAKRYMQTLPDIFQGQHPDQQLADYVNIHLLELPQYLQQLTTEQLDIHFPIKNWAIAESLSQQELFVLLFCAELDNHYWLNLALQELQGVHQDNFPKLHLLCDLISGVLGKETKPSEVVSWASVKSGLLEIQQQGPLILSSIKLNQSLWQLLNNIESAQSTITVIGLQDKNPRLLPLAAPVHSSIKPSITLPSPGYTPSQLQSLDDFAMRMRLNQIGQLHLYANHYSGQAFAASLAERCNLTAVIPSAEWLTHPAQLIILAKAYAWLLVLDANSWPAIVLSNNFSNIACVILHSQQDFSTNNFSAASPTRIDYLLQQNSYAERLASWQQFVPDELAQQLASRWLIDAGRIQSIMNGLPTMTVSSPENMSIITASRLKQAPASLQDMAFHLPGYVGKKGLILNPKIQSSLQHLFDRCLQRETLFSGLGNSLSSNHSTGVKALFSGDSGTGKTLAASYLASQLGIPIYRMDSGSILNKYVGETEKNIHKLMQQTADEDFILLIDEADALFGKRTDAESGGERFANMLTNYLLARIEQHSGIVLMTTNGLGRIDPAFMRRFDMVIEFQSPEMEERANIWQSHLGERSPGESYCRQLASMCDLTGGFIRNAVLAAAAEIRYSEQKQLPYPALLRCLAQEYRKSGKPIPPKLISQLNAQVDTLASNYPVRELSL